MSAEPKSATSRAARGAAYARSVLARILAPLTRVWPGVAAVLPRAGTFVIALALTATVTDLMLRLTARRTPPEPVEVVMTGELTALTQAADVSSIAYLLGAQPDSATGDIKLLGVIAQDRNGGGIALLSLDGKPARAARAGRQLAPNLSLVEVRKDRVIVNRAGALHEIRMAPKPPAAGGAGPVSAPQPMAPPAVAVQPAAAAAVGQAVAHTEPPSATQPAVPAQPRGRRGPMARPGSTE